MNQVNNNQADERKIGEKQFSEKDYKRMRTSGILYMICSVLWAVSAILNFISDNKIMGFAYIALSAAFLGLAIIYCKRGKEGMNDKK